MLDINEKELLQRISKFSLPNNKRAALEISATLAAFFLLFGLMIYGLEIGYWLSLILLPFTAILTTRLFTIQHDCGHGSYFSSTKINNIVGSILGVLTFTPYHYWKKTHHAHHAFSGNLDKRGIGDMDTLTVKEYQALPLLKKIGYRIYRHPAFILLVAPPLLFGIKHRLPLDNPYHSVKSWTAIMLTNAGLAVTIGAILYFFGLSAFLLVYLPVAWFASSVGVAEFYIQHQYEDAYWNKDGEWKYFDAGLKGSSYFEYPKILNWLMNDINLHHIHHLNGRIPSYRLRECLKHIPELQAVTKRTLADIPACFKLALWDDERRKMVGFG
jgi:omega-6 fatty acid desaturase (delta-12 desaturase)